MVDQAFRDAAYPEQTGEAFVLLVEIAHASLAETIYLTDMRWDSPLMAQDSAGAYYLNTGGHHYYWAPFEVIPPGQSDDEPQGKIRVPNIDQRIGAALDSIYTPALVTVTGVLESDPTVIVGGPHANLKLQNVTGDAMLMEGDLLRQELSSSAWPRQWVRPAKYKAAFRR